MIAFNCFAVTNKKTINAETLCNGGAASIDDVHATAATSSNSTTLCQNFYSSQYFYRLINNIGKNVKGSCGYVAIAMLLSYYDTYLNDNIIPEQYDSTVTLPTNKITTSVESPGIFEDYDNWLTDGNGNALSLSDAQYYSLIEQHYSESLHFKLIKDGGLYNSNIFFAPGLLEWTKATSIFDKYLDYLYKEKNFTSAQISYEKSGSDSESFVKEKLKAGIPVLIGASNRSSALLSTAGHYVVAYDYDEVNDKVYCHFGWFNGNVYDRHRTLEDSDFKYIQVAVALNINLPHVCSNNYVYTDYNGVVTTRCPCELSIHPNHVHSFLGEPIKIDEISHNEYCSKCQETITCSHTYNDSYLYRNTTNHYAYCACGAMKSQGHAVKSGERYCLLCGGLVDTGFAVPESNAVDYVTENGSYILPNGVTVLAEADVEAYLNGTLRFYRQGEVAA